MADVEKQDGDGQISGLWEERKRSEKDVGGKFEWEECDGVESRVKLTPFNTSVAL
jgi:hypothetical protein